MMKSRIGPLLLLISACLTLRASAALNIWPQPAEVTSGDTVRYLSSSFRIVTPDALQDDDDFRAAVQEAGEGLWLAEAREGDAKVAEVNDVPLEELKIIVSPAYHLTERDQVTFAPADSTAPPTLRSLVTSPLESLDESYTLHVPDVATTATIHAHNALAALRALATFSQLVSYHERSPRHISHLPVHIVDRAAFPYRGLMLDTARNYLSPEVMKRQMDVMALVKLNQLHWHVTDTSSWPLALHTKGMQVLAQRGAYSPSRVYDAATIRDLVTYGVRRGVNVIVEIDMPGHQFMGVLDYPGDLIVCGDQSEWTAWGNEPPTGHLDIRKPAAGQLMKDVLSEVVNGLPGQYFSTGNDEVNAHCFGLAAGDTNGTDVLLAPFVESIHQHLRTLGKTAMVWEEAALTFPITASKLLNGTLVEVWTGSGNAERILRNPSLRLIHAPADYFYLDCGMGSFLSNDVDGASWCSYVSWQKQYSFDPYNGTQAVEGSRLRVMGGESALWSEQVDEANVEQMLWPRAAAGAEVFWTGAEYTLNGNVASRNIYTAAPRMLAIRQRMRAMGIGASPLQPEWCSSRPGRCALSQ